VTTNSLLSNGGLDRPDGVRALLLTIFHDRAQREGKGKKQLVQTPEPSFWARLSASIMFLNFRDPPQIDGYAASLRLFKRAYKRLVIGSAANNVALFSFFLFQRFLSFNQTYPLLLSNPQCNALNELDRIKIGKIDRS
jgi:hypothetical protein